MTNGQEQARSFEASLEALEQIVRQLESGDLPLEKSLELFEQGIRLSRECQERLSQAERRIEVLLRDNQGRAVVWRLARRLFERGGNGPPLVIAQQDLYASLSLAETFLTLTRKPNALLK